MNWNSKESVERVTAHRRWSGTRSGAQWTRNTPLKHISVGFGGTGLSHWPSPVLRLPFPAKGLVWDAKKKKKGHRSSISAGLSQSFVAPCLFFRRAEGAYVFFVLFLQPVRRRPSTRAPLTSPLCSSAQHMCVCVCVFYSFLSDRSGVAT